MAKTNRFTTILMAGVACAALSACGADDIASPGEGTIVLPGTPTPTPGTPTPTPGTGGNVTAAANCPNIAGPNQLTNPTATPTIADKRGNSWRVCQLPSRFTQTTTLPKVTGVIYSLPGRVDVGTDQGAASTNTDVTLNIDAGVVFYASTGNAFLAVNRGNKINAVGTASAPIIFTSESNVKGDATDQTSQQWGGVVLLGRAKITDCLAPAAAPGTTACERDTEGASNALYGGANDADNSGRMSYVQIRYSGFVLSGSSELQGLTPSGVGTGTQLDHIQVHNSSDDGIEIFGGSVHPRYLVLTGNEDDNLDTDIGFRGTVQYLLSVQREGNNIGDSFLETDSNGGSASNNGEDALPRQYLKVANFTYINRSTNGSNGSAMLLRGGADLTLVNGLIVSPTQTCLRIDGATTVRDADTALQDAGKPRYISVSMQCLPATPYKGNNGVTAAVVQSIFEAGPNSTISYTPSLTSLFINGATETARPATDPKTIDAAFTTTNYVGAVKDSTDNWYAGWTCNSVTATFGTGSGNCTDIPTT
ncbi:hypothetical protein NUH86_13595 [Sphingobium sp. JS3065]|uniref:hypothetical protein n=1 Tax=Sphingobium sp. JS3065 TaxID=2970925 RepID=UPI0022654DDA|nr:hypothetical protein [Sphingobium sp. JS3065]UZW54524.1 hypothetical protein NUH86_13595 [Sphingobium sp. JS3065]